MSYPIPFHSIETKRGLLNLRKAKAQAVPQVSAHVVSYAGKAAGMGAETIDVGAPIIDVGAPIIGLGTSLIIGLSVHAVNVHALSLVSGFGMPVVKVGQT